MTPLSTPLCHGSGYSSKCCCSKARVDLANNAQASLFLSIHFNGDEKTSISGTTVYYDAARQFSAQNQHFASLIDQDAVAALYQLGYIPLNCGVQTDSSAVGQGSPFYVLGPDAARPIQMPGALAEGFFLNSPRDAQQLRDPKTLDALAHAYAQAVTEYFSQSYLDRLAPFVYGDGSGTIAASGRRPASFARSPPLATVICPAFAQGTFCFHCWSTARCARTT